MSISTPDRQRFSPPRGADAVRCSKPGCNGEVLRHSLGCGMADYRCTRCFTRYASVERTYTPSSPHGLQRFLDELVSWREED